MLTGEIAQGCFTINLFMSQTKRCSANFWCITIIKPKHQHFQALSIKILWEVRELLKIVGLLSIFKLRFYFKDFFPFTIFSRDGLYEECRHIFRLFSLLGLCCQWQGLQENILRTSKGSHRVMHNASPETVNGSRPFS